MVKKLQLLKKLVIIAAILGIFNPIQSFWLNNVIAQSVNSAWNTAKNNPILIGAAALTLPTGLYSAAYLAQRYYYHTLYWNWDPKVTNTNRLVFPKGFIFGAGSAAHQVESECNNNTWSENSPYADQLKAVRQATLDKEWQDQKNDFINYFKQKNGRVPTSQELEQHRKEHFTFTFAGDACMAQEHYKEDVQLLKKLGCTAYRLSIDWPKVMPEEGKFDEKGMEFYINLCNELIKNGIKPVVTLYHYTEPKWFAAKGGFEKKENIQYFVQFCSKVFEVLGDRVHLYFTFNSPIGGFALNSYQQGNRPPFKKDWNTTFAVIKNVLDAHVAVYKAKEEINKNLRVGILKNIHQLDPARVWHPVDQLVCSIGNKVQDDPFYQFFTTGKIDMEFPFGLEGAAPYVPKLKDKYIHFTHENKDAPQSLDFIGLNYYGHRFMKGTQVEFNPREERCGTPGNYHPTYTIYAEGLYRALTTINEKLVKPLEKSINRHIPIYVTENGIGTDDDEQRNKFMSRYLYALSKAIQDGIDIRGYLCWALLDNYEWGQYNKHYGLYKVDRKTQERTLKPGASHYRDVMLAHAMAQDSTKTKQTKNKYTVNNVTVTIKNSCEEHTTIPQEVSA